MESPTFTVAELGLSLANAFQEIFAEDIWVVGEIRNLSRPRSGHVYFDLVEPTPVSGATPVAKFRVTLFSGTKVIINKILKRAGNIRMDDGMQIRIRAAIDFYEVRGELYLRMTSIDPTYTLGLMAAERDMLLRTLEAEGLLTTNRTLEFSMLPLSIGLITSRNSAAEADFLDELGHSTYAFHITAIDTPVQGNGAEDAICEALLTLSGRGVDVIAIVRGGGSRTDLVVFDSEAIARTIASLPVPVITGIGHEIDRSVADEVAHAAHKTPTACAAALVDNVRTFRARVDHAWHRIAAHATAEPVLRDEHVVQVAKRSAAAARSALRASDAAVVATASRINQASAVALGSASARLDRSAATTTAASRRHLRRAQRDIGDVAERLKRRLPRSIDRSSRAVDGLEQRVRGLDPTRTLARGWTITRRPDGSLVRSAASVVPGDTIVTTLVDGTTASVVSSATPGDS